MTILLAAVDDSAACRPILEIAAWVAKLVDAQLVAVHVRQQGSGATAREIAQALDVPLFVRDGAVVAEIGAAGDELHAAAVLVGARSFPGSATPAGHVALALAQVTTVPLVIVPPEVSEHRVDRILVALGRNGDADPVLAAVEQLSPLDRADDGSPADIVAVHVFGPDALPPFGDDPTFETEVWAREFLRRASASAAARVHLDLRVGDPAVQVCEAVHDLGADLVVLAWHRDLAPGHGRIVRRVLETVRVPVVLLNARTDAAAADAQPALGVADPPTEAPFAAARGARP